MRLKILPIFILLPILCSCSSVTPVHVGYKADETNFTKIKNCPGVFTIADDFQIEGEDNLSKTIFPDRQRLKNVLYAGLAKEFYKKGFKATLAISKNNAPKVLLEDDYDKYLKNDEVIKFFNEAKGDYLFLARKMLLTELYENDGELVVDDSAAISFGKYIVELEFEIWDIKQKKVLVNVLTSAKAVIWLVLKEESFNSAFNNAIEQFAFYIDYDGKM